MVKAFSDTLHVSWRDDLNGGYGMDVITNASVPAPYAKYQSLIIDAGYPAKFKTGCYVEAYYSIPSGANITLAYSLDRGDFIKDTNVYTSTNLWQGQVGYCRFDLPADARFRESQIQLEVSCDSTVTTPPKMYMAAFIYDDNKEEVLQ
jgi:hypothetical protein